MIARPALRSFTDPRVLTIGLIAIGWIVIAIISLPGHLSHDSITQLDEGRNLRFWTFNPPAMSLLIGLFDRIVPGTGLYMLFVQMFFFGTLLILIATEERVSWIGFLAVAVAFATPVVFDYQAVIWKDVLSANLMIFAFALLLPARRRSRWTLYAGAILAAAVATVCRQNAGIGMVVLICAILWIEAPFGSSIRHRLFQLGIGALTGVILAGLAWAVTNALVNAVARERTGGGFDVGIKILMSFDMAGIVVHSPGLDLSFAEQRGVDTAVLKKAAEESYLPYRVEFLSTAYFKEVNKLSAQDRTTFWLRLIAENPSAYLHHRFASMRWLLWPPDPNKCPPIHVGIDGPRDLMRDLGLAVRRDRRDEILSDYGNRFANTPLLKNGAYLVAALFIAGLLAFRGNDQDRPLLFAVLAGVLFALSFVPVGLDCDYRYLYLLNVAVVVGVIHVACAWRRLFGVPPRQSSAAMPAAP